MAKKNDISGKLAEVAVRKGANPGQAIPNAGIPSVRPYRPIGDFSGVAKGPLDKTESYKGNRVWTPVKQDGTGQGDRSE